MKNNIPEANPQKTLSKIIEGRVLCCIGRGKSGQIKSWNEVMSAVLKGEEIPSTDSAILKIEGFHPTWKQVQNMVNKVLAGGAR